MTNRINSNDANWAKIEKHLLPIVKLQAKRFSQYAPYGALCFDDLVQEGRLELFLKLKNYNEKRSQIKTFATRILFNFYSSYLKNLLRQKRMAKADILINNEWKTTPRLPVSTIGSLSIADFSNDIFEKKTLNPYQEVLNSELEGLASEFINELREVLDGSHRVVLDYILELEQPKQKSQCHLLTEVAELINIKRTSVLWSSGQIKKAFIRLTCKDKYSELFEGKTF